jgi:hypothetical protein
LSPARGLSVSLSQLNIWNSIPDSMERIGGNKSLKWEQSAKLASRLTADGDVVATLTWAKNWGSLATAESAAGEWTLKRLGFLRPRITLRKTGSKSDYAVLSMNWGGGGHVAFSDGGIFELTRSGFWNPAWVVLDSSGGSFLSLKPDSGWRKKRADVKILSASIPEGKSELLAILAWYVVLLISDYDYDGGGATAAVMASSGF